MREREREKERERERERETETEPAEFLSDFQYEADSEGHKTEGCLCLHGGHSAAV